jgi:hypothetical protein
MKRLFITLGMPVAATRPVKSGCAIIQIDTQFG